MEKRTMTFDEYSDEALKTAVYPRIHSSLPIYPTLKLAGEAGEVSEKIGKIIRDKNGELSEDDRRLLLKELGDVLWYVNAIANELESSLDEVADMNIKKLSSRAARGTIQGSGDER
jgi:NTP pyrophosphatase (non-canonical NTP hydrolase)